MKGGAMTTIAQTLAMTPTPPTLQRESALPADVEKLFHAFWRLDIYGTYADVAIEEL